MIKILLIEDDMIDQMAFERMVKKQALEYDYTISNSIEDAKVFLNNNSYDLVITDYNLGDGTAFEIFDLLEDTMFILATGAGDEEIAVQALRAGAYDYLVKDAERNYLKVLPLTIEQAYKRKQKDERLRLLEAVVVNANDAVLITTAKDINNLEVVYANDAFLRITGYELDEIVNHSPKRMQGESTDRKTLDKIRLALENNESVHVELINYTKEKEPYWVDLNIVPLFNDRGVVTHFVSIQRDITERKEAERELIEAKQLAENAQAAEKQFLANMSHEIRTPMNAVIGMTHLLLDADPSEKQLDYLNSLKFSADNLLGIINDILDVSKIESGKIQFEEIEFDLIELLHSVQKAFRFKIRDKKKVLVTSNFDLHFNNYLLGDATRLTQMLTNLLGNAGKFTEKGEINLSVRLIDVVAEVNWIEFKVSDTGIGIAPEKMKWVFDKFKQADSSINRQFGGTGLGLAIVKQLVELQGGSIEVESKVDQGTTFVLNLPFKDSNKPISIDNEDQLGASFTSEEIPKELQLLIVEDNLMNQKLIKIILDQWGLNYQMADNGKIALEVSSKTSFDLILMDIQMPVMDGYEATTSIRGDVNNPNKNTPIIALSAAALVKEKRKALSVGMNDFLTKPYTPNKLKSTILSVLEKRGKEHEPVQEPVKETVVEHEVAVSFDYLKLTFGGDDQFVREMVDLYLEQNPIDLEKLEVQIEKENWDKAFKIAHKIKSGYLMMGMKAQELLAAEIEFKASKEPNDATEIIELFRQLKQGSMTSYQMVKDLMNTLS